MCKTIKFLIGLSLLCVAISAQALLSIEVTQGVRSALPVAIVPFSGQGDLPDTQNVSDVITQDLMNSGEFNVTPQKKLPARPYSAKAIQLSSWRALGVQDMLVGSVQAQSGGNYRVAVNLVSVYQGDATKPVSASAILYSKVFTVKQNQLRGLAHQISDQVYKLLIGDDGTFTSHIAYVQVQPDKKHKGQMKYHLIVADYDGYNPKALVTSSEPLMSPTWAPNGKQIAFVSFQHTLPAIYDVNVATGKLNQITQLAGINGAPAWSPDGMKMAFVSSQTGQAKLYEMDLLTKNITQLTTGYSIDTEPSYSPDSSYLVFTSNRGGKPQIYRYTFSDESVERLSYSGDYNATADVSPDGKYLAVLNGSKHVYNIALQDLATDHMQVLTGEGYDESPSFSPNGKLIIYATRDDKSHYLAIVSRDGQIHIQLPTSEGQVQEPAWGL
jgi:TolB protein